MAAHSPWENAGAAWGTTASSVYVGWHIRTSEGESARSFDPNVNRYIFHGQPSSTVFPLYLSAMDEAAGRCPEMLPGGIRDMPVYISSNRRVSSKKGFEGQTSGKLHEVRLGFSGRRMHGRLRVQTFKVLALLSLEVLVRYYGTFYDGRCVTCCYPPTTPPNVHSYWPFPQQEHDAQLLDQRRGTRNSGGIRGPRYWRRRCPHRFEQGSCDDGEQCFYRLLVLDGCVHGGTDRFILFRHSRHHQGTRVQKGHINRQSKAWLRNMPADRLLSHW